MPIITHHHILGGAEARGGRPPWTSTPALRGAVSSDVLKVNKLVSKLKTATYFHAV